MLSALKTKRARLALGLFVLLAFTGAAVAYFTTTGAGSGNATVGASKPLTITATITPGATGFVPGTSAPVSFSVNNPGGNEEVATVSLSGVTAYTNSSMTTTVPGCLSSWFAMTPVTENQDVPNGTTTLGTQGTLQFNDVNSSQNACQNAYLVASFTSN